MTSDAVAVGVLAPGLVERLSSVDGVEGVTLGGSRGRGAEHPGSDYDLGLYYRGTLDVAALQRIADDVSTTEATMTVPGDWGPWVDGGGWLRVDGVAVDIIYRDLDRVQSVWADCRQGRFSVEIQGGHPLGFWSHAYAGEVALGMILNERTTEIAELQAACTMYPEPLATALVARLWESAFSVSIARKATSRVDVTYVAGCLFRAAGVMAQSMHGHAHRWLINEKGAIAGAADLGAAPVDFVERVHAAFELLAPNESRLSSACDIMQALVDDVAHNTASKTGDKTG